MKNNNTVHIAIVGAGVIGINCAIALRKRGFQVSVFDNRPVGEGCSKANAGHFATEQVFPLAEFSLLWQLPKLLFNPLGPVAISPRYFPKALPWFFKFIGNMFPVPRQHNTRALRSLNEKALACYQTLLTQANAEHLLVSKGSLLVFEDTPIDAIKAQQQLYLDQGVNVELLDKAQVKSLEPNLANNINYALYFTHVAHTVNPLTLSQTLAEYAKKLGVNFYQHEVKAINHYEQGVSVVTNEQTLCFDKLVLATGAWSKTFVNTLGYELPLEVERGYSLDLPASSQTLFERPIASAERKFIMTPMAQGLRLAGTVEFAGLDKSPTVSRIDMLYKNASFIVDNITPKDEITDDGWLGFRPSLPDSLPVIGIAPNHQNIALALGHQHLGLTLGAITGKLVGQILDEEATDVDIQPFCISRFN